MPPRLGRRTPVRAGPGELRRRQALPACVVVKRFLQGKRLNFQFVSGGRTADVDLTRSTLKALRWNLNLGKKLGLND